MADRMKVLIAYDGSPSSDEALADLRRAGLPDDVEAVVLSVADLWVLPEGELEGTARLRPSPAAEQARATAAEMKQRAHELAERAAAKLQSYFPKWEIAARSAADSPAWAIVLTAEKMRADLIVVGSHGHTALGRWVLGSVSHTVLTQAHCSVRIGRSTPTLPDHPLRIIVGIDGSLEADQAVRTVAQRTWPAGTDIRLVMVTNPSSLESIRSNVLSNEEPEALNNVALEMRIERMFDSYLALVAQNPSGIVVTKSLLSGDPKRVLVDEAAHWGADCIFIGSRGLSRWDRLLLGSVSTAVAQRAPCSVEVVRKERRNP